MNFKELRLSRGLPLRAMHKATGYSATAWYYWEIGKSHPTTHAIGSICAAFNVTASIDSKGAVQFQNGTV